MGHWGGSSTVPRPFPEGKGLEKGSGETLWKMGENNNGISCFFFFFFWFVLFLCVSCHDVIGIPDQILHIFIGTAAPKLFSILPTLHTWQCLVCDLLTLKPEETHAHALSLTHTHTHTHTLIDTCSLSK